MTGSRVTAILAAAVAALKLLRVLDAAEGASGVRGAEWSTGQPAQRWHAVYDYECCRVALLCASCCCCAALQARWTGQPSAMAARALCTMRRAAAQKSVVRLPAWRRLALEAASELVPAAEQRGPMCSVSR